MTPELKCPIGCGITLEQVGPENPLWRHGRTMAPAGHRYCILESRTGTIEEWTARRTPDLTEALARLKALEGDIRDCENDAVAGTKLPEWADEIAAIRKAIGAGE